MVSGSGESMTSAQEKMFVTLEDFKVLNEMLMDHTKRLDAQQVLIQKIKNTILKQDKEIGQMREEMEDANFIDDFEDQVKELDNKMEKLTNTIKKKDTNTCEDCNQKIGILEEKLNKMNNLYSNIGDKCGLIDNEHFETEGSKLRKAELSHKGGETENNQQALKNEIASIDMKIIVLERELNEIKRTPAKLDFNCVQCDLSFRSKSELKQHIVNCHNSPKRCTFCGAEFLLHCEL